MSLAKLYKPSETALRQLFNRPLFLICVLSSNGKMAPNSPVSHEFRSNVEDLLDEQRKLSLAESYSKANIFLGLINYKLNSLIGASHLVDYVSVHIRFNVERYSINSCSLWKNSSFIFYRRECLKLLE